MKDGALLYLRGGGGTWTIGRLSLSHDSFFIKGTPFFRMKSEFDEKGDPAKVTRLYGHGS
jgi:hypothetical protein